MSIFSLLLCVPGCAVVEPSDSDRVQVQRRILESPGIPIEQMSREIGISQAAIIAALPQEMRQQVPADDAVELFNEIATWGEVVALFDVIGHRLNYRGPLPTVSNQSIRIIDIGTPQSNLSMMIARRDLASIWLVRYPAGQEAIGRVVFCEEHGETWMVIELDEKTSPGFSRAWDRYSD